METSLADSNLDFGDLCILAKQSSDYISDAEITRIVEERYVKLAQVAVSTLIQE